MYKFIIEYVRYNLLSLVRPFVSDRWSQTRELSDANQIVDAFIYDWDNAISVDNKISQAQVDYTPVTRRSVHI